MLRNGTRTKTGRTGKQQQQKRLLSYVEEGDNKLGCRHVDKMPQCRCPPGWRVSLKVSEVSGVGVQGEKSGKPSAEEEEEGPGERWEEGRRYHRPGTWSTQTREETHRKSGVICRRRSGPSPQGCSESILVMEGRPEARLQREAHPTQRGAQAATGSGEGWAVST